MMEGGIDPDAPLEYAEFELFPSQNRYEVCICSGNKVETAASGLLEQLLLHSPEVKNIYSKRPKTTFQIQLPNDLSSASWFTKSILTRFLYIVESPDILDISKDIENEISQLEETKRFQLSIDVKSHQNRLGSGKADDVKLNGIVPASKAEAEIASSDASKNELLRVMDLRLTALKGEVISAFNQAAGTSWSTTELIDLETFSHHFGAVNIRDSLRKFVKLSQKGQTVDFPSGRKFLFTDNLRNRRASNTESSMQIPQSSVSDTPVKYGVSPAKVAQLERQSSTETDESSSSSEDERPSAERSRTLGRSATPRRSASPMRRIQIGRSGSRRAGALTIKSLNYFPGRERLVSHMDAANSEAEESEQPPRKPENNAQRISVQAAISLFESKQRDQTVDIQKAKSLLKSSSIGANKSVLRRWSSGMSESSAQLPPDIVSESSVQITPNNSADPDVSQNSEEVKQEPGSISGFPSHVETLEIDYMSESERRLSNPTGAQDDTVSTQQEESSGKFTGSAEWSQQKEAELNQLLSKMMESKPSKYQKKVPDDSQHKNASGEQRGGFYDHYKQKRDQKLREVSGKRAEKEEKFKAMQKFLEEKKAEMVSTNASVVSRRHSTGVAQKSAKNSSLLAKPKKETSKPALVKKTASKASPLPATRNSWPSAPSPRAIGSSPAKTSGGTSSTGPTPTRGKSQPVSAVMRSSPKVERPQPRPKTLKSTQSDLNKSTKGVTEKKQQTSKNVKTTKTTKPVVQTTPGDNSSIAKPSLYNKVTRKSSVVPLELKPQESKPFLRKGSRVSANVSPSVKTKVSSLPEESLRISIDVIQAEENELVVSTTDPVSQQQERDIAGLETHAELETEGLAITPQKCADTGDNILALTSIDCTAERLEESTVNIRNEEESIISPRAWVEIEEEYQEEPIQYEDRSCQVSTATSVTAVGMTSPRVRHSLSQMLLEESSEADITEWGNAENPPAMVYQKDAPKGLKRLLKFARKSKLDSHSSGWSTPSAFSEGEDEAEESKTSKKNAENLLKKAALNATNYGPPKTDSLEAYGKNTGHRDQKMQEGHISASATTSKATRSFFSLSAFKGSKPNETKLR